MPQDPAPLPAIDAPVRQTAGGTPYLQEPGLALICMPATDLRGMAAFLGGFDPELGFAHYLEDPVSLPDAERLCKAAGQLSCGGSWRRPNGPSGTRRHLDVEHVETCRGASTVPAACVRARPTSRPRRSPSSARRPGHGASSSPQEAWCSGRQTSAPPQRPLPPQAARASSSLPEDPTGTGMKWGEMLRNAAQIGAIGPN